MMQYIEQIMKDIPHLGTLRSLIIFSNAHPWELRPIRLAGTNVFSKSRLNSFGLGKTRV